MPSRVLIKFVFKKICGLRLVEVVIMQREDRHRRKRQKRGMNEGKPKGMREYKVKGQTIGNYSIRVDVTVKLDYEVSIPQILHFHSHTHSTWIENNSESIRTLSSPHH